MDPGRITIPRDGLAQTRYVKSEIGGDAVLAQHGRKPDDSSRIRCEERALRLYQAVPTDSEPDMANFLWRGR